MVDARNISSTLKVDIMANDKYTDSSFKLNAYAKS